MPGIGPLYRDDERANGLDSEGRPLDPKKTPSMGWVEGASQSPFFKVTRSDGTKELRVMLQCEYCKGPGYEVTVKREHISQSEMEMERMLLTDAERNKFSPYRCPRCKTMLRAPLPNRDFPSDFGMPRVLKKNKGRKFDRETI